MPAMTKRAPSSTNLATRSIRELIPPTPACLPFFRAAEMTLEYAAAINGWS